MRSSVSLVLLPDANFRDYLALGGQASIYKRFENRSSNEDGDRFVLDDPKDYSYESFSALYVKHHAANLFIFCFVAPCSRCHLQPRTELIQSGSTKPSRTRFGVLPVTTIQFTGHIRDKTSPILTATF